jgi:hypothetical protein
VARRAVGYPEHPAGIGLVTAEVQPQRLLGEPAEADIDQPRFRQLHPQRHVVERVARLPVLAEHARRQPADPEAERGQQGGEGAVQLVTEATTPVPHQLGDQRGLVQHDRLAEVDAQVLERHRVHVRVL